MAEVLIAGAGPAGSIAAIVLARAGVRVRLIDRARFPRPKLCGDTVNPGALAILDRLDLSAVVDDAIPVHGMWITGESGVQCEGLYGGGHSGRSLSRQTLDMALLRAASRAGVCIEEGVLVQAPLVERGRVTGLILSGSSGQPRTLRGAMVIAADGASSRIARALVLSRHRARPRRWAIGAYFENVAPGPTTEGVGEMHLRRDRYIGIAPLPEGLTNVCVVTANRDALRHPDVLLTQTVREDRQIADRFVSARRVTAPICLGPLAVENSACGVPGLLLAGDAAGFIDPMTGDGLRFAFRGGELAGLCALSAIQDGGTTAHESLARARRREFTFKWRFNRTLRALSGSPIALQVAGQAARLAPRWLRWAVSVAGDLD